MSWVRIDDAAPDHPKLVGLDDDAFALWVRALCYCARHGTDGRVPGAALPRLTGSRRPVSVAEKLVRAGLWTLAGEDGRDYEVHDFLDYNLSAEETKSRRETRTNAGRAGGLSSGKVRSKPEALASRIVRESFDNVEANANPPRASDPRPVPAPGDLPPPSVGGGGDDEKPQTEPEAAKGESAETRYRKAYVAGVLDAAPGAKFSLGGRLGLPFVQALGVHAPGIRGEDLDAWIRRTVARWRRTGHGSAAGWRPARFLDWLNSGAAAVLELPLAAPLSDRPIAGTRVCAPPPMTIPVDP